MAPPDASEAHRLRQRMAALVVVWMLAATTLGFLLSRAEVDDHADRDTLQAVQTGVDPNRAAWFELAQLPGIGESLARRIVAFREERLRAGDPNHPVFEKPGDLSRVRGIGERTVHRIAPYLRIDGVEPRRFVDSSSLGG